MSEEDHVSPELPEVLESVLSEEEVSALVRDLEACASGLRVGVKRGSGDRSTLTDLSGVLEALAAGASVQIRYAFEGSNWCDTLRPRDGAVHLIRMNV